MQASIFPISPMDAAIGGVIRFSWTGNQAFKNRCIIKSMDTNTVVYDNTIDSFKLEHTIDLTKAGLENGVKYLGFITVFDKEGTESDLQDLGEPFYCFTTPSFQFDNVTDGQIVRSSTLDVTCSYAQPEGELLDSWSITLYNHSKSELDTTGIIYDTASLSYTTPALNNKTEYFIRATGTTVNGIFLDTGYIGISVTYEISNIFSLVELTNLPDLGAIQLRSNIVASEGRLTGEAVYIDGESIDLRDDILTYTDGFILSEQAEDTWSLAFKARQMKVNAPIPIFSGEHLTATLYYRIGRNPAGTMCSYVELRVSQYGMNYIVMSSMIPQVADTQFVGICIIRQHGLYRIELKSLEVD